MSEKLTWEQVVELEPRLQVLFDEATAAGSRKESFCAFDAWYGRNGEGLGLKQRVSQLVGWGRRCVPLDAREMTLQSHTAYDVAYQTIYHQLSDCRNAGCDCMG